RLEDFDLEPKSFDVVVTISYLEHEPNPRDVLRRIFHLLCSGGVCVHKVPNYDSLLRRVLGQRWSGYRWPEHFQYYTPKTLGRLVAEVGFEVLRIDANPLSDSLWLTAIRPTC
ncbi:MAG: class I SAM-dependent methyltransferase, partial [Planctomycetes bacterium]|nr:class I SAM-dependent methyltransferase [Planctomycetota bacterium]